MNATPPKNEDSIKRFGLARVLSKMGYCSRSEAEGLVREGRVTLNGEVRRDPETPVLMGRDHVAVDGAAVQAAAKSYWMLNKPRGLVTTADDEKGRDTVYSLLPAGLPWMGPVGRLDMDSEGLLLMTNDTTWANRITAPESHLEKTYHVQIGRVADRQLLERFEAGVDDFGEVLKARRASILREAEGGCWLEIVLDEGKNRHIRRMAEAAGINVLRLVRVKIGGLALGDLPGGAARELTAEDLRLLL